VCGRAALENPYAVAEWFDVEVPDDLPPRFNIAPTQLLAVVRTPRRLELLKWGIARDGRPPQINMRVETIGRTIHTQRRCLVVLDGFYEWRPGETPAARQPFVLRDQAGHPLGFAGVWSRTTTKDGEVLESVAVMTCPPRPPVDTIHDRMPLVIPREHYARWIDPGADVSDLLQPTATTLVATPVSTFVNSPKNDDQRRLARWEVQPAQRALF
jgi:putative SOS response-associated peptidase YedK